MISLQKNLLEFMIMLKNKIIEAIFLLDRELFTTPLYTLLSPSKLRVFAFYVVFLFYQLLDQ